MLVGTGPLLGDTWSIVTKTSFQRLVRLRVNGAIYPPDNHVQARYYIPLFMYAVPRTNIWDQLLLLFHVSCALNSAWSENFLLESAANVMVQSMNAKGLFLL